MEEQVGYAAAESEQDILERQLQDFWGFDEVKRFMLPDGIQYIEHRVLSEGDRAKYQKATSRDIAMSRTTGEAKFKADPAEDRHALIKTAVCGWKMYKRDASGKFVEINYIDKVRSGKTPFEEWLLSANPRLVEDLERDIRKANPWLLGDMSVEDIDREMENLADMRKLAEEREAGKLSSDGR